METKAEYTTVCTDELTALILEVQDAGEEIAGAYEWGTDPEQRREKAATARAALREYVEALRTVIAAKEQVIEALRLKIEVIQAELRERDE